jgi:cellulose synthase/poly-beta-1,6-N-acetylglucosamine synthase-like glycosyltransferase
MLARLFAFEYAALFRGIVPWLSDGGKIFPLGGTSNHFRRSALETIGCWDPHNVTEDADMGIRLLRHGFRISTISRPTLEDAPDNLTDWLKQRTRWYKGWMQTWLVHNRSPAVLRRDIGTSSFIFSQILFAGMIVSALVHPAFLFSIGELLTQCISGQHLGRLEIALAIIDTSNIVLAYSAFLLLGYRTLTACEKYGFFGLAIRVPLYWLAISIAAWRALFQLVRNPFLWEKTPHKRHYQQGGKMFRSPRSNENPTTAI